MTDCTVLYRESRERITALVRAASEKERAWIVPSCPKWTISDTVAHLDGGTVDNVAGYGFASFCHIDDIAGRRCIMLSHL